MRAAPAAERWFECGGSADRGWGITGARGVRGPIAGVEIARGDPSSACGGVHRQGSIVDAGQSSSPGMKRTSSTSWGEGVGRRGVLASVWKGGGIITGIKGRNGTPNQGGHRRRRGDWVEG
ncbi:hypothetical protein TIFTF001_022346 [Ficus carica]|uniref:Uncharacterized protein n=1 Tax=Ficus carica TaxID=3494 RepID=A0AA88AVQ9_FICCA|nr:hypothetical protein TIFTF001_022346 [Ficus carica]